MGMIFFVSAQSRLPDLSRRLSDSLQDVLGHFVAYAILALLVHWALEGFGIARAGLWTLAITFLYGLSDEFHQSFVPGRAVEAADLAADVAGAGLALLLPDRLLRRLGLLAAKA